MPVARAAERLPVQLFDSARAGLELVLREKIAAGELGSTSASEAIEKLRTDEHHGFKHSEAVLKSAWSLADYLERTNPGLKVDKFVLGLAAIGHDLGRVFLKSEEQNVHPELSAEIMSAYLDSLARELNAGQKRRFGLTERKKKSVLSAIKTHDYFDEVSVRGGRKPLQIEGWILRAADILDRADHLDRFDAYLKAHGLPAFKVFDEDLDKDIDKRFKWSPLNPREPSTDSLTARLAILRNLRTIYIPGASQPVDPSRLRELDAKVLKNVNDMINGLPEKQQRKARMVVEAYLERLAKEPPLLRGGSANA